MSYFNIQEEELKNKVAKDVFTAYDCTMIIGNIDFCVTLKSDGVELYETQSLLWAEAKKGNADIYKSISQLILTIGKARTFDKHLPPPFLGAFDAEKIAFVPYSEISEIFYINDFNWNVTPSDYSTKEFLLILSKVTAILDKESFYYHYDTDKEQLKKFLLTNFIEGRFGQIKIRIDKNNFMVVYNKWMQTVKPTIGVKWEKAKEKGILDGDFYLADLLSQENSTLIEKLFVLLKIDHYELDRKLDDMGLHTNSEANFIDKQVAHNQFWNKYDRPPKKEYWDYIINRRDLLVPQDVRERKGSFFTPQIWVELSQKYIADALGENWQDEYYVWDCAAGTGNLLAGLTNKYNIWASTLDQPDVDVMHERIENGANLLKSHVFQFDFLNDEFTKLPEDLQKIIKDPEKRKKLVIYINPPYAEAGDTKQRTGTGKNKDKTTTQNRTYEKYKSKIGKASNELFTQFLIRIYFEIDNCYIANFSKLKILQSVNFKIYRELFQARLKKLFLVPANTFDNVKGQFPIGFHIWELNSKERFEEIKADIYDKNGIIIGEKNIINYDYERGFIGKWLSSLNLIKNDLIIGMMNTGRNDFQNQNLVHIQQQTTDKGHSIYITKQNIIVSTIFFSVRHCIEATWLNDRDQFLYPKDSWEQDIEFQNYCLAFTLFHGQNRITSKEGTNHWIPFTEDEVNAKEKFESHFMTDYISGNFKPEKGDDLFSEAKEHKALEFSPEAKAVFGAGLKLWQYYHAQEFINYTSDSSRDYNPNASLYDIKEYFQGRNDKGRMNSRSEDEEYMQLIKNLREKLKDLAKKLEPKVYEHGFLKG